MNITEIRKLKSEAEKKVRNIILDFSNKTGLIVEDIRFQMWGDYLRESPDFSCTSVEFKASIEEY